MSNVSGIIKSIQDIMRKDVGVDGDAQRISQMVWMFFLKILDDREEELALLEKNYKSPLPEHLRWRAWAKNPEGITGEPLADFVNLQLFPTLKNKLNIQGPNGKRAQVVKDIFEDAYNYMKSGTLMRQVINKISEIDFNVQSDRHTFGNIYEQILKDLQSAGNAGEFYTPRAVTKFIVDRVNPQLEETVLDPACGTGGFLANVIEHKRARFVKSPKDEEILQGSISGGDKKSLPYMLCMTNMILHGIDTPTNIRHDNTLRRPYQDYTDKDRVDIIVTNPPFGGIEEDGIENNFPANLRTRETADLFVALIIRLLKENGRAAVVLPDGFFFGEGMKTRLKEKLLEECNLHTIVRLPNGVFNPYTGIKTNLLFFRKGQSTKHIWYYEHPYPDGVKSYNKTKPIRFEEFQPEINWWGNEAKGFETRVETEQAWKVSIDEIKARNYNLDIKNPHIDEQIIHDPDVLLQKYAEQQQDIAKLQDQLKDILAKALGGGKTSLEMTNLITNHIDIWTLAQTEKVNRAGRGNASANDSLYGIKKLRELILELAVRGKLVPQDPNDKPASVLLEQIANEKARLIKEGIIKKQEPMAEIRDDEKPFELPKGWMWQRLGDIGYTQTGGTPSKNNKHFFGNDVPFIKPGDIYPTHVDYSNEGLSFAGQEALGRTAPSGSILMVCIGTIGKCNSIDRDCSFNQQINSISPYIDATKFLLLTLRSNYFQTIAWERSSSTTIAILNKGKWVDIILPVAPLAEQHRIVAKVDELMALCHTLEARINDAQNTQVQLADAIVEQAVA